MCRRVGHRFVRILVSCARCGHRLAFNTTHSCFTYTMHTATFAQRILLSAWHLCVPRPWYAKPLRANVRRVVVCCTLPRCRRMVRLSGCVGNLTRLVLRIIRCVGKRDGSWRTSATPRMGRAACTDTLRTSGQRGRSGWTKLASMRTTTWESLSRL